jgi:hypothetical protein
MCGFISSTMIHNQLSGPIPTELGNLSKLTELYLAYNQFSGSIPLKLNQIQRFSIHYNSLVSVTNIGTFKASSFDSNQILTYLDNASLKRAIAATQTSVRTFCVLDDALTNEEILNQCLAGIESHCSTQSNFGTCKSLYEETFKESAYHGMEICAPWNSGSTSPDCQITGEIVKKRFAGDAEKYRENFVEFVKNDLFSSRQAAPCYESGDQKCHY